MKEHGCVKNNEFGEVRWVVIDGRIHALKSDVFRLFDITGSGKAYTDVISVHKAEIPKVDLREEFGGGFHSTLCLNEDIVSAISVYSTLKDIGTRLMWVRKDVFKNPFPLKVGNPPEGYKINPVYVEVKSKRVNIVLRPSLYEAVVAKAELAGISFNEFVHRALEREIEKGKIPSAEESDTISGKLKNFEATIKGTVQNLINNRVNNIIETCINDCIGGLESRINSKVIDIDEPAPNNIDGESRQQLTGRKLLKSKIDRFANIAFDQNDEGRFKWANNMFVSEYNKIYGLDLWGLKTKCETESGKKIESIPAYLEMMGWINNALIVINTLLEKYGENVNEDDDI